MENIKAENKKKYANLNKENAKFAKRFYWDLTANVKASHEKQEIYSDFLDMLYDAQTERKKLREVIPDYNEFLDSCISNLDRSSRTKKLVLVHRKLFIGVLALLLSCIIIFSSLFASGAVGVWSMGIEFMHNSYDYYYNVYSLDMALDLTINLNNTNSNEGVTVYQKGNDRIELGAFTSAKSIIYVEPEDGEVIVDPMSISESQIMPMWFIDKRVPKVTSYYLKIVLKTTGNVSRTHAQIISGKAYDHQNSVYVYGYGYSGATLKYTVAGVEYTVMDSSNKWVDFYNSDTIEFVISVDIENEEEKLYALLSMEQLKVTISGLVVNQWDRM